MPAALPTYLSIITSALRKLGAMGSGESAPGSEDTEYMVNELNELVGIVNKRKRFAWYMRQQEFAWTTARQSYTIGASTNSPAPNFSVTAGNRPVRIEAASLVLTDSSPDVDVPLAVWNWPEYSRVSVPALTGAFPYAIYYEPAAPNGVIYPYPAFPSETSNKLKLWWRNQLLTMSISEIATELNMAEGYDAFLASNLAVRAYSAFPKRTDIDRLERMARVDAAEIASVNVAPFIVEDSGDGIQSPKGGGGFLYQSRTWLA